ncbi:MAG: hypothetical protein RI924_1240 [Bacteroidota bacterium]|jgi:hypothetical protein
MNFLSHYYFDRTSDDPYLVLGTVLPDLLKNANKNWNPHPQKQEALFQDEPAHRSLLEGWKRHLLVDKYFHSSAFFNAHLAQLKQAIGSCLQPSKVWPSFLAHISLELMLDSLLITDDMIDVDQFYEHLKQSNSEKIADFLKLNQIEETEQFFSFFEKFIASHYLDSYRDSEKIVYALNRISMRLWPDGLAQADTKELTRVMMEYRERLKADFRTIFEEIQLKMNKHLKP